MRVTWKFVVLSLAVTASATMTLVLQNQRLNSQDSLRQLRSNSETQARLISSMVRGKTEFLITQMTQFVYVRSASRALNGNAQQILSHFDAIALLTVADHKSWSAKWVEKNGKANSKALPEAYLAGLFTTLPISSMDQSAPSWVLVEDVEKRPVLALLSFVQLTTSESAPAVPALMVGLVNPSYLADAVKEYAGTRAIATVLDHQGGVLAHSDSQWVGQNLNGHELWKAVASVAGSPVSAQIQTEQKQNLILAGAPINASNAVAVLALPIDSGVFGYSAVQLSIFGLGIIIIAGLASFYLARSFETQTIEQAITFATTHQPVETKPQIAKPVDEEHVFQRISASLAQELKAPVVALLGHVQIALSKLRDDDTKAQLKTIEKEARRVKKVIDGLAGFAGFDSNAPKSVSLQDSLEKVLRSLAPELENVLVETDFTPVQRIQIQSRQLEVVCEELIRNALQAMKQTAEPRLNLAIEVSGAGVRLKVKDNGEGISSDIRKKMFEPFVSSEKRLGLGLPVVKGILLDQGAHLSISSDEGTEFIVDFLPDSAIPKLAKARNLAQIDETLALAEADPMAMVAAPKPTHPPLKLAKKPPVDQENAPEADCEIEAFEEKRAGEMQIQTSQASNSSLKLPEHSDLQDFRVKIRRPKLKAEN